MIDFDKNSLNNNPVRLKDQGIDLSLLVNEFAEFQPDDMFSSLNGKPFTQALVKPEPEFVTPFIKKKLEKGYDRETAIRDLYAFLLDKRYNFRINLLYFVFDIFDDEDILEEEIINMTPLPHEDGTPLFKYRLIPDYRIE